MDSVNNMDHFDWQQQLRSGIYSHYRHAHRRAIIGITANYSEGTCKILDYYYKAVVAAGGTPVLIPPVKDQQVIANTLQHIDALILSGGADYNPLYAGEQPEKTLGGINDERDLPELWITRMAYHRQLPILGICRGIQTMAMALGGRVKQDINDGTSKIKHSQDAGRNVPTHTIQLAEHSMLHHLYGRTTLAVNSFHHQAVADTGSRFCVTATSPDGIVEAMESTEMKPLLGVQWHPECIEDGAPLFRWIVEQAEAYNEARRVHSNILTLDTHCDTPMLFPKDINFATRDERILVDLHKMDEGALDATIMVCYLPQPKPHQTFQEVAPFDVKSPTDYANLIFDKIEQMVEQNKDTVGLARNVEQLCLLKQQDKKAIMLGIENGLALNGNPQLLQHFKNRGVVYVTLCHNGDNDLCDSAKGSGTHGGVSPLGAQVIAEMNRLGMMVDLSHASEKSFYDALQLSTTPIVCSHSSARSLCNHPRNLTDDQMRALAAKGGVAQITLYPGFLSSAGNATLLHALQHLEHAISIMGIDHVGIGTDFDGDGGVPGIADASEVLNVTRHLLARRYSVADIQKIWGGNFMRVMQQVQDAAQA